MKAIAAMSLPELAAYVSGHLRQHDIPVVLVGDSPVRELNEVPTELGVLTLLTPTDCIKDRLSAYYHWSDRQSLQQAVWVARGQLFDQAAVQSWSEQEGMAGKYADFIAALNTLEG